MHIYIYTTSYLIFAYACVVCVRLGLPPVWPQLCISSVIRHLERIRHSTAVVRLERLSSARRRGLTYPDTMVKASPKSASKMPVAERRLATKSRKNLHSSMREETLGKLTDYLREHPDKIYSVWCFATSDQKSEETGLDNDSPMWHDTYIHWSIIARYFHGEVLLEFCAAADQPQLTKEKAGLDRAPLFRTRAGRMPSSISPSPFPASLGPGSTNTC